MQSFESMSIHNASEPPSRLKKHVPKMVDERDSKKHKKTSSVLPETLQEVKSKEYAHHPAEIAMAAVTIQRFFKKIKEKKLQKRKGKKKRSIIPQSSSSIQCVCLIDLCI